MEEPRSILKRETNVVDEKKLDVSEETGTTPPVKSFIPHHEKLLTHRLGTEIENIVRQQANKALRGIEDKTLGWKLLLEEDDMRIYRRDEEINGIAYEPIKAFFTVSGITAFELCHFFFSPEYRYDWDVLVDNMVVIEEIDDDSLIFMQKYKRVCFSSQRDSVFWSHIRQLENESGSDQWVVVNHSTEHPDYEEATSKCVRLHLTACLFCQTQFKPPISNKEGVVSREQIRCKITYCATINPGGWIAAIFLKPFYKKECSRFLRRLTTYAKNRTKNNPIRFN
ncbi:ceramide transfer protein-like [Coccinella septempunctata]|uniref:ceramide transfer protein-like n=1 Tax=Coccinella septempunctata TaxID=41139 RepID=UPI001D07732B|nr:ceramide transfer protein-like [Coccinella septempunctata]